jgi:hypothetical protein
MRAEGPPRSARGEPRSSDVIQAVPGLVRISAVAWTRTARWSVATSWRAGSRLLRAAATGESPEDIFQAVGDQIRDSLGRLLGSGDESKDRSPASQRRPSGEAAAKHSAMERTLLRERGAELLRQSAQLGVDEDPHPAYARILDQLTPDEARILRLLAREGPQPAIDVRTGGALTRSELLGSGLNMIGDQAGCRHPERVDAYLSNLHGLGLVWFSHEQIGDQRHYQVLEAQPQVSDAMEEAGKSAADRRSIELTPLGEAFCATCLPLDTVEIEGPGGRDATDAGDR